ncbi:kelch repeat-containing protein [Corallococcus sp. M7]
MAVARAQHTATLLPTGKVLVTGGADVNGNALRNLEVYDVATGVWAPLITLNEARSHHTVTLLPSGKLIIVGGRTTGGHVTDSVEHYDSATGERPFIRGHMDQARSNHTATLLPSGKVLVVGGWDGQGAMTSAELYDPQTYTWTPTGALPSARSHHTATLLPSGKVLVAGGWDGEHALARVDVYDPATGTWTSSGAMTSPRTRHTATLLPSGKVLVAGGSNGTASLASAEVYDPGTGTWTATGALAIAHDNPTATLLPSGKVLVAGGQGSPDTRMELYDEAAGTWASGGDLTISRDLATATLLPSGEVLILGGSHGNDSLSSAELYAPRAGTWTDTAAMSEPRIVHTATLLPSGKVLVAGGAANDAYPVSAELYDPQAETWTATGSMTAGGEGATATLLPSGKVLVAGGYNNNSGIQDRAEVFDPGTGTWAPTGSLSSPRSGHTATLLGNGKVLVLGGSTRTSDLASAEVYDPATGSWSATNAMSVARRRHTTTRLLDGKVLVVGGNGSAARSSAELYDPATGTWTSARPPNVPRTNHTATLLPSGKVLIAAGSSNASGYERRTEVYDPATGTWTLSGMLNVGRHSAEATLLPTGQVLIAGGAIAAGDIADVELYEQETGTWASSAPSMNHSRLFHVLTLLPSGKVLSTGGFSGEDGTASAEVYEDTGALDAWRPTFDAPVVRPGEAVPLTGNGFLGLSEASSGNTQGSATNFPMLNLMAVEGDGLWRVPVTNASDTSLTALLPQVPAGYYLLTVITNAIPGGRVVRVQGAPLPPPTVATPVPSGKINALLASGTAEPGSTVTLVVDGRDAGSTRTDANGGWSFTSGIALDQGGHELTARATDAEGHTSQDAPSREFTFDSVAPAAPWVQFPAPGYAQRTTTPLVSGNAESGSTVTLFVDGVLVGTTPTYNGGRWDFPLETPLAQGIHSVTAYATDEAGNRSPEYPTYTFTVDSIAPDAPVVKTPAPGAVVNTSGPTVSGTAEPGSTVTLTLDGRLVATVVASDTGTWSTTMSVVLLTGSYTLTAHATDAAGNPSQESSAHAFRVDLEAPEAPVVLTPAHDAVVTTQTPILSGRAEPGSTVTLVLDGLPLGSTTTHDTGAWSFTPGTALAQGRHTVTVQASDAAGHASPVSPPTFFSVDSIAPDAPVVVAPAPGAVVKTKTPVISGTAEHFSTVHVSIDGVVVGSAQVDGSGNWSLELKEPLAAGHHTLAVTAVDAPGNTSTASAPASFTVNLASTELPPESEGCAAAPGSATAWMAIALGLGCLRRRKKQGASK